MTDRTDRTGRADVDAAVDDRVREELVRFVRALRRAGASVPANAATTAARALAEVGLDERDRARTALRASLLSDREDFEAFDRLFETFWRRLTAGLDAGGSGSDGDEMDGDLAPLGAAVDGDTDDRTDGDRGDDEGSPAGSFSAGPVGGDADADAEGTTTAMYSPSGRASPIESGPLSDGDGLGPAFGDLTRSLAGLQGRRFGRGTDRADVRRALRASVSTGGTVLSVPRRERRRTAVRALVLVDVSQSVLDVVDRGFLIDFLRRARRDWRQARVFLFDEDVREVSRQFDAPSTSSAMAALEAAETAWGGGTRIGGSIEGLHESDPDAVDRRTVVFVVSDGLEMGDVDTLERELSWLSRRAKRVFWLNPLAASGRYEPTARGMAAALPYVDGLFAFARPADVTEMARQLRRQGPGGRIGYEFDPRTTHRETTARTENDA
ncbi:VWA domain-containing protein [Salinirubellus sp. GCM10025818]|uniref:VWA domain-containing protein n=1 Tax=Salinirubellus TaxID=2162630 RepID=UPI0030D36AD3